MSHAKKALISTTLAVALWSYAPCVTHAEEGEAPTYRVGLSGALGQTTFYRGSGSGVLEYTYENGYGGGVFGSVGLRRTTWGELGGRTEVLWFRKGARAQFDSNTPGSIYRLDYLDVPVLACLRISVWGPLRIHAIAGPRLGFQLDGKRTDVNGNVQDIDDFRKIDLGISVGLGASFKNFSRFEVMLEGRYDQGLLDIADANADVDLRHRAFFLMLGISMGLGSPPHPSGQ
jgi:hypothetical protein